MVQEIRLINRHFCIPATLGELGTDRAKSSGCVAHW